MRQYRRVTARWTITAALTMQTAAQIGAAAADNCDQTFGTDEDGNPFLPGTTLAGALRSALADRHGGYRSAESEAVRTLFGHLDSGESALIVFDSVAEPASVRSAIRDGVRIGATSGVAEDKFKYDRELTLAGLGFPLRLDLLIPDPEHESELLRLLCDALAGLTDGAIRLGARRSRGLGACQARAFRARRYDLTTAAGWEMQADDGDPMVLPETIEAKETAAAAVAQAGGLLAAAPQDRRERCTLKFDLSVKHTLLIRSPGQRADSADMIHLTESGLPVLSGTSIAGAFRSQAVRILRTLQNPQTAVLVDDLFGKSPELAAADKKPTGSRIHVEEPSITNSRSYRQTRNKVDRFTGGTIDAALFDEEPCVGGRVRFRMVVRNPTPDDIGLMVLLARDLIEGTLPIGGEASVGRGVFRGTVTAHLPSRAAPVTLAPSPEAQGSAVLSGMDAGEFAAEYLARLKGAA